MEEQKKSESDGLKKGRLAKLQARIQNKYMQMQRKNDKSRSVESIATLADEYSFKENRHSINSAFSDNRSSTNSDFGELKELDNGELNYEIEKSFEKHEVVIEQQKKNESDGLKKGALAKLQERIQNKYMEMQRKIDKSRSVESIATFGDEYSFKENRHSINSAYSDKRSSTNSDFGELKQLDNGELNNEIEKSFEKHDVVIEHVKDREANEEVFDDESSIFEVQFENENEYLSPLPFFESDFKVSCDSLNELPIQTDAEFAAPPVPPPKMSLRDRIGSRLAAAKESRKNEKVLKNEKVEKLVLTNSPVVKKKQKTASVTIALIDARELENEPSIEEKSRVVYCRFRLGPEKRKSKAARINASMATFQELFDMNVYDEYLLQISLWEKNALLGKTLIDLLEIKKEKTHKMQIKLEDGTSNFQIFFLLTITGTSVVNTFGDFNEYQELKKQMQAAQCTYIWRRLWGNYHDVGQLTIIVYGAKGLSINESYCVVQVTNESLHTHSVSKTNAPRWNKMFIFNVTDVTSVLEVIVMDEKKSEVAGKISIYLLKVCNGEKKWYALKDSTLRERAKGNDPKILLEMNLYWNVIKGSTRVIRPKEVNLMTMEPRFHRQLFSRNLSRARAVLNWTFDASKILRTAFEWESKKWNTIALTVWLLFCWYFKIWMLPLLLLAPFFWYRPQEYFFINWKKYILQTMTDEKDDQDKEDEKKSLRQKINTLHDMILTVQNAIGKFASLGERIKNLFNFTIPFLSLLTIFFIIVMTSLLYVIPVKYVFMTWGIHKYVRKIRKPNRIPNNEMLDLLSRVPDDEALIDCQELEHQQDIPHTESDIFQSD